ncbi:MAG: chromate transporter [Clostridiales bacterium]|nr:chromate transporter [Clostridiales bacterium]
MAALELFWVFVKIGFTSFGGLSMVPLINAEMVAHGWMTASEVSDIVAIAEMTPGPLGLNSATFVGIRVYGVVGALSANLGVLTPTLTVCFLAAVFLKKFQENRLLQNAMYGIRPTALGMILATMYVLGAENYIVNLAPHWQSMGIGAVVAVLLAKFKWSIPAVILMSAAMGLLIVR